MIENVDRITGNCYFSTGRAYPFLSGTKRKTFENSKDAIDLPGPGYYNPQQLKRHVPESTLSIRF